jgi:hypothetical protein
MMIVPAAVAAIYLVAMGTYKPTDAKHAGRSLPQRLTGRRKRP